MKLKRFKKKRFLYTESVNKIDKKYRFSKDNLKFYLLKLILPNKLAVRFCEKCASSHLINDQKLNFT